MKFWNTAPVVSPFLNIPVFDSAGTGANGVSPTPSLPANSPGDLFIAQATVIGNGTITTPSGWVSFATVITDGFNSRHYAFYRIVRAAGGESGSVSFVSTGTGGQAVIYSFTNVSRATTFLESVGSDSGTTTTVHMPSITTVSDYRRAFCFVYSNGGNNGMVSSTGETGGDWIEATPEFTSGLGFGSQVQTADMTSVGTISGGTFTVTSQSSWMTIYGALIGL